MNSLRDLWPPFVFLLDVVRDCVHRFLILGRILCVADVEGVGFEPHYLQDKLFSRRCSASPGPSSWTNLGFSIRHVCWVLFRSFVDLLGLLPFNLIMLLQHGLLLPNGNGNVLEYNLVIEDY